MHKMCIQLTRYPCGSTIYSLSVMYVNNSFDDKQKIIVELQKKRNSEQKLKKHILTALHL